MLPKLWVDTAPLISTLVLNIKLTKEIDAQDGSRCGAGKQVMGCLFLFSRQILLRWLKVWGKVHSDISGLRAPVFVPVSIPVRSMSFSLFALTAALFATACKLLSISDSHRYSNSSSS